MFSLNFVQVHHANPLLFLGITGQWACFAKFWHFIIQSIHIPILIICVGRFYKIHWPGVYNYWNLFMTVHVVGFNQICLWGYEEHDIEIHWHKILLFYIIIALYLQLLRMQDVEKARKKRKIDWMKKMWVKNFLFSLHSNNCSNNQFIYVPNFYKRAMHYHHLVTGCLSLRWLAIFQSQHNEHAHRIKRWHSFKHHIAVGFSSNAIEFWLFFIIQILHILSLFHDATCKEANKLQVW